jgi:hypothetical protein
MNTIAKADLLKKIGEAKSILSKHQQKPGAGTPKETSRSSTLIQQGNKITKALSNGLAPDVSHVLAAISITKKLGAVAPRFSADNARVADLPWKVDGQKLAWRLYEELCKLGSESVRPIDAQRISDVLLPLVGSAAKVALSAEETLELENFAKTLSGVSNSEIVGRIKRGEINLCDARAFYNAATEELPEYLRGHEPFASALFRLTGVFTQLGHENPVEELAKLEKSAAETKVKAEASFEAHPQVQADENDLRKFSSGELDPDEIEREWQRISDKIEAWNDAGRPTTHGDYKELETQIFKLGRLRRLAKRADNSFTK